MRLLVLQYAGDYRSAVQTFSKGGPETYYAQKYSVESVAAMTQYASEVSVISCVGEKPYNEMLENGVRSICAGFQTEVDANKLIELIEAQNPTHLVICTPIRPVLRWAIYKKLKILVALPESIVLRKGLRGKVGGLLMSRLLNHQQIDWVGSYGITSSLSLKELGINEDKIIPWDLLITDTPGSYQAKFLPSKKDSWKLLYVGSLSESKGVGDVLEGMAKLKAQNFPVSLQIVGRDNDGVFAHRAKQLGIENDVSFLGIISNDQVVPLMREADVVLVPSRHEYTEGFPLTIHHALCARTPIVASDHPMFRQHLKDGISAVIFPETDSSALAQRIQSLLNDPVLYNKLSEASYPVWYGLRLSVKWADLLERWGRNSRVDRQWLFEHRLASGRYPHSQGAVENDDKRLQDLILR